MVYFSSATTERNLTKLDVNSNWTTNCNINSRQASSNSVHWLHRRNRPYLCQSEPRAAIVRPKQINVEFPLTLPKKIKVGRSVIDFIIIFNFICYSMNTCSMASRFAVPIRWYVSFISSFQFCINQFANKICRVGAIK